MRLLAVALVAASILAGCSGSTEDTTSEPSTTSRSTTSTTSPSTSSSTSSTTSSTSSSSTSSDPEGNHAPVAVLAPLPRVAVAPANITFHIDADDQDAGDSHTWRLTFGDGTPGVSGTETPFTVVHNYTAIGNYTAVLLVSDTYGVEDTAEELVVLTAEYFAPILFNGTADIACGGCVAAFDVAVGCVGFNAEQANLDCDWVALPANATFQPFTASGAGQAPESDVGVIFADSCAGDAAFVAGVDEGGANEAETGEVPEGAGCLIVYENANVANTFTVRVG